MKLQETVTVIVAENYYFQENGLPYNSDVKCNMLPTGHYVFRVGAHDNGTIEPALRMSEPTDLSSDARACVWRTKTDLVYGLLDVLDPPRKVYDNIHCSYFTSYSDAYEAMFSLAGCLTVRGRKDPSHQWAKFQDTLDEIGQEKRADLIMLTGKEAALASEKRASGLTDAQIFSEMRRLRIGSKGSAVKTLQSRLGRPQTGYFDAETQHALHLWQSANGQKPDAIYSPATDQASGWAVF